MQKKTIAVIFGGCSTEYEVSLQSAYSVLENLNPIEYKMMFRDYPDVVTVEQMCEMLGGISTKTGYRLLKDGTIKSFVVGRRYRIPKLYIFEYLEIMERGTANT